MGDPARRQHIADLRDRLAQHVFVGGNAFMVRMLNRYRNELGVAALPAEMEATARATVRQLQDETASVSISSSPKRVVSIERGIEPPW